MVEINEKAGHNSRFSQDYLRTNQTNNTHILDLLKYLFWISQSISFFIQFSLFLAHFLLLRSNWEIEFSFENCRNFTLCNGAHRGRNNSIRYQGLITLTCTQWGTFMCYARHKKFAFYLWSVVILSKGGFNHHTYFSLLGPYNNSDTATKPIIMCLSRLSRPFIHAMT